MSKAKLGSLFDGIGGFPAVAQWYDIEPTWASEIEEPCIRITKQHFPNMTHLGDITQIHGDKIEPVDIISGGSPCTNLSCAGTQKGISLECPDCGTLVPAEQRIKTCPKCGGELEYVQSGLFIEQIRIIKEMREATQNQYPKYVIWENVCFTGDTLISCESGFKPIKDVHIGDKVKTLSGKYHTVYKCHRTKHQPILELKARGAFSTKVTANHPFYVRVKTHKGPIPIISEPMWVPAKNLTKDHMVGYRLDVPDLPEDFISEIDAWILGRWLADGSVDLKKSNPRIFISVGEKKVEDVRKKLSESSYGIHENRVHSTAVNFTFTSYEFYGYIAEAGIGASNKRVPGFVFRLPYHLQKCVLDGYISGDGSMSKNTCGSYRVNAGSSSRELMTGIARLVRNIYHIPVSFYVGMPKNPTIDGRSLTVNHPVYSIEYTIDAKYTTAYFDGEFVWQHVKSIEPCVQKETVYNLSVLEDNTYEANSIICHNCGAISSNEGDDFKCVLNEFCGLFGEELPALRPEKWPKCGEILGDSGSLAWRTFDAQYWGVPQRRRRIYLVVDLTGQRAGEILFKPESLRRHTSEGKDPWKRTSGKTKESIRKSDEVMCVATQQVNAEICTDIAPTLTAANGTSGSNKPYIVEPQCGAFLGKQGETARSIGYSETASPTLTAGEPPQVAVYGVCSKGNGDTFISDKAYTVTTGGGQAGQGYPCVFIDDKPEAEVYGLCSLASNSMKSDNPNSGFYKADVSKTLDTTDLNPMCNQGGNVVVEQPVYCIQGNCIDRADTAGCNGKGWTQDVCYTLTTIDRPAVAYAVHENQRNELRLSEETAYALTTGGGKPSQGAPVVLTEKSEVHSAGFAFQAGAKSPSIAYGEEVSPTLVTKQQMAVLVENHPNDSRVKLSEDNVCQTLSVRMETGGGNVPLIMEAEKPLTTTGDYMQFGEDLASTLMARDYKDPQCVLVNSSDDTPCVTDASHTTVGIGVSPTITAGDYKASHITMAPKSSIVRRLTPLEAERLQGFEDGWTATESDSARYKALGNSVALPCVDYVVSGIADLLYPETNGDA